jgi:hypothetical protein
MPAALQPPGFDYNESRSSARGVAFSGMVNARPSFTCQRTFAIGPRFGSRANSDLMQRGKKALYS